VPVGLVSIVAHGAADPSCAVAASVEIRRRIRRLNDSVGSAMSEVSPLYPRFQMSFCTAANRREGPLSDIPFGMRRGITLISNSNGPASTACSIDREHILKPSTVAL
jgi:hypothetical protein